MNLAPIAMLPFTVKFNITEEDFLAAQRAHQRRNAMGKIQFAIGVVLFTFFILLAILGLIFTPREYLNWVLPLVLAGLYIYLYFFAYRSAYRKNPGFQEEVAVTVSDEGLFIVTPNSQSTLGWKQFLTWVESPRIFLMYQQPKIFNLLPKRILTQEQQDELRAALTREVGQK